MYRFTNNIRGAVQAGLFTSKRIISALALAVLMLLLNTNVAKAQNVCKIGGTEYATIADAYSNATSGQTITLIADAEITSTISVNKNITIDMAGYDITVSATGYAFEVNGKTFTIKDSSYTDGAVSSEIISSVTTSPGVVKIKSSTSTIDFSNISIHGGAAGSTDPYYTDNGGKNLPDAIICDQSTSNDNIKLTNTNIYTKSVIVGGNNYNDTNGHATSALTVDGGWFTGRRGFLFSGASTIKNIHITTTGNDGNDCDGCAIYSLKSCTVSHDTIVTYSKNDAAVKACGGTITIDNSFVEVHARTQAAVGAQKGGTVTIYSGTFTSDATNNTNAILRSYKVDSGVGTINLRGGLVDGSKVCYALYADGSHSNVSTINVYGGTVVAGSGHSYSNYAGGAQANSDRANVNLRGGVYQGKTKIRSSGNNQHVFIYSTCTLDVANGGQFLYGGSTDNNNHDYLVENQNVTIYADMAGVSGMRVKLIDYLGSNPKTMTDYSMVELKNNTGGTYSKSVIDNDLYAVKTIVAGTLYVDDDWATLSAGTEIIPGLTVGTNAFGTIQKAVNAANVSEGVVTINVAEGTYNEEVNLNQSNLTFTEDETTWYGRVNIVGEEGATITGSGFTFGNGPSINVADVTISGFTFEGYANSIYIDNNANSSKNITISNNTFKFQGTGIYVMSADMNGVTISGNKFNSPVKNNATIGGNNSLINDITISGNTFGNFFGLYGSVGMNNATISGNTFAGGNTGYGLWINNQKAANTGKIILADNDFATSKAISYPVGFNTTYAKKADIVLSSADNTYAGTTITGWSEVANDKFVVSANAEGGLAQYYDQKLYLGDETAFANIMTAYNAASANGILVMMDSNPVVEIAKSSITANKLGVNTAWEGSAQGTLFNVGDETYCWGINAYSTVAAATAAVQTGQTVKLFSDITGTAVSIPAETFLNTNANDLTATGITMGSKFTVNVTGLDENTKYWVMYYDADGNWAGNDYLKPAAGQTTYTKTFDNNNYASSKTYNASTWELSGITTYATTFATIELDEESTVTFTGFVDAKGNAASNTGVITVDMTGATENSYKLMDYIGSNDAKYGIKGSGYKFAEGKDNGYTLQTLDNDLVAYKSTASKAAVAIKSDWAGTAFGTEVTLNGTTYTYGISGFSNFTDALGATDATTTSVVINGETFGINGNTGTLYLTNTSGQEMTISTFGAAVSSYPEACTGTYLSVGSGSEKQSYKFTEGSDLTVFQFYTGGSSNIDITVDGALKTEGSTLLNGANVTVSKNGSMSLDGSHRPSASGTIFHNWAALTVKGDLNLNINDIGTEKRVLIGDDGYNNDGIELIVDGGTATVRGVENTTGVEKFSKNPATTVIGGKVGEDGTPATLSVTNGGLYDTDGTIINNGVIKFDVKKDDNNRYSMVKTKDITNTGSITIDVTGATEASYKVIDYTGTGTKSLADYGTVEITGGNYMPVMQGNDLYVTTAVCAIGDTKYHTLGEAMTDARNASTPEGKTITIFGEIPGFDFNGDNTGITLIGVEGNKITGDFGSTGNDTKLKNTTFKNLNFIGAKITFSTNVSDYTNFTIDGCTMDGTGAGTSNPSAITINRNSTVPADSIKVINNRIENYYLGGAASGIIIGNSATKAHNVVVSGNNISNVGFNAVQLLGIDGLVLTGNTASGCLSWAVMNVSESTNIIVDRNVVTLQATPKYPQCASQSFIGNAKGLITLGSENEVTTVDGTKLTDPKAIIWNDEKYVDPYYNDQVVFVTDATVFDEESGIITDGPIFASAANINSRVAEGYEVAFMNDVTYSGLIYYTDVADKTVELAYGNVNGTIKVPQGFTFAIKDGVTFTAGSKIYLPIIHGSNEFNNWVTNNIPEEQKDNVTVYGIVCKIGETMYNTVADAIEAAQSNDVITMLASTSENVIIPAEKTVTLDLNGKTLSCNDGSVITNNGTLTLTSNNGVGVINGGTTGVEQKGILTLSGKVNITDNTKNLYLPDGKTFSIVSPINGMWVGITTENTPIGSDIVLTNANADDYSTYFFSDNPSYSVRNSDGDILMLTNGVLVTLSAQDGGEVELFIGETSLGTSAFIPVGSSVTIKAKADNGYAFKGWFKSNGEPFSGKYSYTFTVTTKLDLNARFTDDVIWVRVKK